MDRKMIACVSPITLHFPPYNQTAMGQGLNPGCPPPFDAREADSESCVLDLREQRGRFLPPSSTSWNSFKTTRGTFPEASVYFLICSNRCEFCLELHPPNSGVCSAFHLRPHPCCARPRSKGFLKPQGPHRRPAPKGKSCRPTSPHVCT